MTPAMVTILSGWTLESMLQCSDFAVQKQCRTQMYCPRATDWAPWYPPQASCTAEGMMDLSSFSSSSHGAQHVSQLFCYCISHDMDA